MSTLTSTPTRNLVAGPVEMVQAREVIDRTSPTHLDQWSANAAGQVVALPAELSSILTQILETLARGGTVTVGSMPEELTTTVAADQLGVSRPTLMKMVGNGEIPAHKVGSHTRLKTTDVLAFRRARLERQRAAFSKLLELEDDLAEGADDSQ